MNNKLGITCSSRLSEGGHVAFYILVLFPIIITVVFSVIDISSWNSYRDSLQNDVSRIAQQAALALPNQSRANTIAHAQLSKLNTLYPELSNVVGKVSNISSSHISINVDAAFFPSLKQLLPKFSNTSAFGLNINREATAQLRPADVVLIMADGKTLRPELKSALPTNPFASSIDWPPAGRFSCPSPTFVITEKSLWNWTNANIWKNNLYTHWATQACFNPAFSALKKAALLVVDSILPSSTNRLSVILAPGGDSPQGFVTIRNIHGESSTSEGTTEFSGKLGGFITTGVQAFQPSYTDQSGLSSTACMLFSHPSTDLTTAYSLSYTEVSPFEPLQTKYAGCSPLLDLTSAALNPQYLSQAKLRDIIYWNIATLDNSTNSGKPNLAGALQSAIQDQLAPTSDSYQTMERNVRGNMYFSPIRKIIILTDDLSNLADFFTQQISPELIQKLRDLSLTIDIVAFKHPYLSESDAISLQSSYDTLRKLSAQYDQNNSSTNFLQVTLTTSSEELLQTLLPEQLFSMRQIFMRDYGQN